jgi:hypothetical protein
MGSHRTFTYRPRYVAQKRPFKRSVQLFLIEWPPMIVTFVLALLVVGLAYQLAN